MVPILTAWWATLLLLPALTGEFRVAFSRLEEVLTASPKPEEPAGDPPAACWPGPKPLGICCGCGCCCIWGGAKWLWWMM